MKTIKSKSGKTYTKKQITEAIAYWKKQLRPVTESHLFETEGDNEASVAEFIFQCLKDSHPGKTGILVHSLKTNDAIDFNGNKVSIRDADFSGGLSTFGREVAAGATKKNIRYKDTDTSSSSFDFHSKDSYAVRLAAIISSMRYDYAVVQLGSLGLPGDIAVVSTKRNFGDCVSVIEVKSNSLGSRVFNPTFKFVDGVLTPVGRYSNMWTDRVMADINNAIAKNGGNPNINGIPLDCDFDDFVKNYSTKNPFGPIEYVALGYGDSGITFYKVVPDPNMDIYGTGTANRRAERRANSIKDEFNAAYLSLRTRDDRPGVYGQVDFCFNGGIMTDDRDVKINF